LRLPVINLPENDNSYDYQKGVRTSITSKQNIRNPTADDLQLSNTTWKKGQPSSSNDDTSDDEQEMSNADYKRKKLEC